MNPSDPLNLNNNVYSDQNLLFQPDFLNVEYFFNKIYLFLKNFSNADPTPSATTSGAVDSGLHFVVVGGIVKSLLYFILVFLITVIAYCTIRLFEIRKKEHEYLQHKIAEFAHKKKEHEEKANAGSGRIKNEKWESVLKHLFSEVPSDWRVAIIDADEMLFGLMDQLGFKGETLGDKLKVADRDEFRNLSAAWEVHTVRNRIAHEGSAYELSQREAKRVIALYEQIFREFGYI